MHQRKSKKILFYIFLFLIFSTIGNESLNNLKFDNIENIKISGLGDKNSNILQEKLKNLNFKKNIFFLNKEEIEKLLSSNTLIETYEIYKNYPASLNIKIKKTTFFAKINRNGKTFLIGSNGKLTLDNLNHSDLPFIFGKPNIKEFINFKKNLDSSNFLYSDIKNFYFFPSKRWDLKFKNNTLLKLPYNVSPEILKRVYEFLENYSNENYAVIDARINNQIILNE